MYVQRLVDANLREFALIFVGWALISVNLLTGGRYFCVYLCCFPLSWDTKCFHSLIPNLCFCSSGVSRGVVQIWVGLELSDNSTSNKFPEMWAYETRDRDVDQLMS